MPVEQPYHIFSVETKPLALCGIDLYSEDCYHAQLLSEVQGKRLEQLKNDLCPECYRLAKEPLTEDAR